MFVFMINYENYQEMAEQLKLEVMSEKKCSLSAVPVNVFISSCSDIILHRLLTLKKSSEVDRLPC